MVIPFFLSRGSQKAPDQIRTRQSRFLIGKWTISYKKFIFSLELICESGKISKNRPEMARDITQGTPKVHPTYTQRTPNVHRRSSVGSPQGALGGCYVKPGSIGRPTLNPEGYVKPGGLRQTRRATLNPGVLPKVDQGGLFQMFFFFGRRKVLALFFGR